MQKLNGENQLYMVKFIKIYRTYLIKYNRFHSAIRNSILFKKNVDFTKFSITLDKNSHESPLLLLYVPIRTKKNIFQIYKFVFSVYNKYAH